MKIFRHPATLAVTLFLIGIAIMLTTFIAVKTGTGIGAYDTAIHDWMVQHRSYVATTLFVIITTVASPIWICGITFVGTLLWAWRSRSLWRPALFAGGVATGFVITALLKHSIARLRPPTIDMIAPIETDFSFPSGHVIGVATLAIVLTYLLASRQRSTKATIILSIAAFIAIILTALSRIYLGYHWPTDTIASFGLAFIVCSIVAAVDIVKPTKAVSNTGR